MKGKGLFLALALVIFLNGCSSPPAEKSESAAQEVEVGKEAPEATFTTVGGKEMKLSDLEGEKAMLWFVATWCPSCGKGAEVLADNGNKLGEMRIIALQTYGNAGHQGPGISEFAGRYAPDTLSSANWIWGEASRGASSTYNPENSPDIYYLIDEGGAIMAIGSAPSATLDEIAEFASEMK